MARVYLAILLVCFFGAQVDAQSDKGKNRERWQQLRERFDSDGNGRLSNEERRQAGEFLRERRQSNQTPEPSFDPETSGLYKAAVGPCNFKRLDLQFEREGEREGERALTVRVTYPVDIEDSANDESFPDSQLKGSDEATIYLGSGEMRKITKAVATITSE